MGEWYAGHGRELSYRKGGSGDLIAVQVRTQGRFQIGEEQVLFPAGRYASNSLHPRYDVSPDGQRFVLLRAPAQAGNAAPPRLTMIQNCFEELKARVPN